jgi:hypothetical protein
LWKRKRTIEKAKIRNLHTEEAKSKSFLHFAFQPFQVFGSRLFASFFLWMTGLQIWGSRKVTSFVGGARYSKLENWRNPELGKVPWNLDTHDDRTHNGVDIVVLMSSALNTRPHPLDSIGSRWQPLLEYFCNFYLRHAWLAGNSDLFCAIRINNIT